MTRRNLVLALPFVLLSLVLGWVLLSRFGGSEAREDGLKLGNSASTTAFNEPSKDDLIDKARRQRDLSPSGEISVFSDIPKSRQGLSLEDDPFTAESEAEQEWLDRNGFPNKHQWEAYGQASDYALEEAASAGDSVAHVMLQGRRLLQGDPNAGSELLAEATKGNSFALQTYAGYLISSSNGDPVAGYAIGRLEDLRGDWRAAVGREAAFRRPLTTTQRMEAEAQAARLYHLLLTIRQDLYNAGAGSWVDPRPMPEGNKSTGG